MNKIITRVVAGLITAGIIAGATALFKKSRKSPVAA